MSRHDLSASDRSWVSAQIADRAADNQTNTTVDRNAKRITFTWQGLPTVASIGKSVTLHVRAVAANGTSEALTCTSTNGQLGQTLTDAGVTLSWTPARVGNAILQCDTFSESERHLIMVER